MAAEAIRSAQQARLREEQSMGREATLGDSCSLMNGRVRTVVVHMAPNGYGDSQIRVCLVLDGKVHTSAILGSGTGE